MSMKLALAILVVFGISCDAQKPVAPKPVEPTVEMTPEGTLAFLDAEDAVFQGLQRGIADAYRGVTLQAKSSADVPLEFQGKDSGVFVVMAGGNNHGETEDCGCRANPLGGLARRASLIDLSQKVADEEAVKWWGKTTRGAGTLVSVDAGDFFYKNVTLARAEASAQAQAKFDAQTGAQALKTMPIDAMLVGELDMVFGLDDLMALQKTSNVTMISANLKSLEGELVFPPSQIVERNGEKIGIVGITKTRSRLNEYWAERKLKVDDGLESYRRAWPTIADSGLRILLSNMGIDETRKLLEALNTAELPDVIIVSNSNRLTQHPEWVQGRPMVEALSQGKYGARLDVYRAGDKVVGYKNASVDGSRASQAYRRAWTSYVGARQRLNKGLRTELELTKAPQEPDAAQKQESKAEFQRKENVLLRSKLDLAAQDLTRAALLMDAYLAASQTPVLGDDWVDARFVPIKLEIPEEPKIAKLVAARKKKRPEIQAVAPAHDAHHGHSH